MTHARAVTAAISNNKDDSTECRNESNNRTMNTVGLSAKAGMLVKVVKPETAYREANHSRDPINTRVDMDVNRSRATRISTVGRSATVEKPATCSNIRVNVSSRNLQLEYGQHSRVNRAETIGTSQT